QGKPSRAVAGHNNFWPTRPRMLSTDPQDGAEKQRPGIVQEKAGGQRRDGRARYGDLVDQGSIVASPVGACNRDGVRPGAVDLEGVAEELDIAAAVFGDGFEFADHDSTVKPDVKCLSVDGCVVEQSLGHLETDGIQLARHQVHRLTDAAQVLYEGNLRSYRRRVVLRVLTAVRGDACGTCEIPARRIEGWVGRIEFGPALNRCRKTRVLDGHPGDFHLCGTDRDGDGRAVGGYRRLTQDNRRIGLIQHPGREEDESRSRDDVPWGRYIRSNLSGAWC